MILPRCNSLNSWAAQQKLIKKSDKPLGFFTIEKWSYTYNFKVVVVKLTVKNKWYKNFEEDNNIKTHKEVLTYVKMYSISTVAVACGLEEEYRINCYCQATCRISPCQQIPGKSYSDVPILTHLCMVDSRNVYICRVKYILNKSN